MTIAKLLAQMENQWFVGREKELHTITEFTIHSPAWSLLHLHGPPGIGKSALLKRFQSVYHEDFIIYLSGLEAYPTNDDFLQEMWEEVQRTIDDTNKDFLVTEESLAQFLNDLASPSQKIILLFDAFESYYPIHKWLREKWLPLLSTNIRLVTASRFQLSSDWQRSPGWSSLIHSLEIGSLKKHSIQQYLNLRGITDNYSRYHIEYYSKGVPLALRIICNLVEANDGVFNEESDAFRHFLFSLSHQLLSASHEIFQCQELLTIASLFWWFDEELVTSMSSEPLSSLEFQKFCQLPYIELCENGCWRVNDDVRQWLSTDLSIRNPEKNEALLKKATSVLLKKVESLPTNQKLPYVLNILHVKQNGFIKRFGFGASNHLFTPGPIEESEIPILKTLFQRFVVTLKPFLPDKWKQDRYFHEVWKAVPESFVGIRLENKIVGFLCFLPLNKKTRALFKNNPVYRSYIERTSLQEKEYIVWIVSSDPTYDPDVTAYILRYIFNHLAEDTLINLVSPFPDLSHLFHSLGFQALDWYDVKYTNDQPMEFLQLDLRNRDWPAALSQTIEPVTVNTIIAISSVSAQVKRILTSYHKPECEALIQTMIKDVFPQLETTSAFRKKLIKIVNQMEKGSEEDQLYATILKLAYIQKSTKHESIATRLNLSLSTYYRYLKRAVENITHSLLEETPS